MVGVGIMTKILKPDHNLDVIKDSGDYVVKLKDVAHLLTVKSGLTGDNHAFTTQILTNIDTGEETFRTRAPFESWTPWYARLDKRHLDEAISKINALMAGEGKAIDVASKEVAGLMSAADKVKLDGIPADADKSADVGEAIDSALEEVSRKLMAYAPHNHEHTNYVTKAELGKILLAFVNREEYTAPNIMAMIEDNLKGVPVASFKGAEALAFKKDITGEALRQQLGKINADKLGGKDADQYAAANHKHDEYAKRGVETKRTSSNNGVVRGEFTPNPDKGSLQRLTNGGDMKFKAPVAVGDYEMVVLIENGTKAGVVEFVGFTHRIADMPSAAGLRYLVRIAKVGSVVGAEIRVMSPGSV
jgi:hypothetical protein